MADAADSHVVWWDGAAWSCTCDTVYLVTDLDAERHYSVMHGQPARTDDGS